MTDLRARFPELTEFLGSYFNQDFPEEYGEVDVALDDFLRNRGRNSWVEDVVAELEVLLAEGRPERELRAFTEASMAVQPPGSATEFLTLVRQRLAA
jgi:hypothetical protein